MVAAREFRSDLYYRLNVFPFTFLRYASGRKIFPCWFATSSTSSETIPAATMKTLTNWEWPGNIRELENFVERTVILTRGAT
jgi:formate hydrogenlyase transcriptional activator